MSLVQSSSSWLRQTFAWSNSPSSWKDRLFLAAFASCAVILVGLGFAAWWWQSPIGWTLLALLTAGFVIATTVCTQQGWLKLFGPVLFYDMICSARRSRYFIMRLLYATLLLSILCMMYLAIFERRLGADPDELVMVIICVALAVVGIAALIVTMMYVQARPARITLLVVMIVLLGLVVFGVLYLQSQFSQHDGADRDFQRIAEARLGETFFLIYMLVQIILVVLLTPAYVAGSIAEEKDRKTIEFLLATDLSNHEIVLSKFCSRLANLTLFLFTGLPILSVLQFGGGVDVSLLVLGFVGTGLTMFGVASVSILFSTLFKKPRDAIGMTYLILITYMALGTTAFGISMSGFWWVSEESLFGITFKDIAVVVNAGNPLVAISQVGMAIDGRSMTGAPTTLNETLPEVLQAYAWFQVPTSVLCIVWSILRIRAIALKQTTAGTTQKTHWYEGARSPVSEEPMLWKELQIENKVRATWIMWIAGGLLVLLTLGVGLTILGGHIWDWGWNEHFVDLEELTQKMNIWFRTAGTGVACLMMLMVGVRASTAITSERERDTFDALLTTPLTAETMLAAKLLSSITSLRMAWLWFGSMVALGLLTGGIHLLAVPIIVTAWFVYAVLFAMIGLWFSMACQTSMRATVLTVLTTIFVGGGHWIVWLICCLPFAFITRTRPGDMAEYLMKFQAGLTPPFVIGFCSYSWRDLQRDFMHRDEGHFFCFSLIGILLFALACAVLWYGVLIPKFRQLSRREDILYE